MRCRFADIARRSYLPLSIVCAALAEAGCDTSRTPSRDTARTVAAVSAPTDTYVRRVVRVYRRASAMQRVTPLIKAFKAHQPLDSSLVIRVLDQRGIEMPGAVVRWSLLNDGDGAQLRIINAKSDSAGLSRAEFVPGRSASAQGAAAEVRDVGRIEFTFFLQVASIRVVAEQATLWSGDQARLVAELHDEDGTLLTGGAASWASTDTTTLTVDAATDSVRPKIVAVRAGRAEVFAWIGKLRASTRIQVRPLLAGRFVTIDGTPAPPISMEVRSSQLRDSVSVDAGQFTKRAPLGDDDVDVFARPAPAAAFHSVHLRVMQPRALEHLSVVLVPTTWRIDAGSYQGRETRIDGADALRRTASGAPFWRLVPVTGRAPKKLLAWREADLPLKLGFDRRHSSDPISPADSAAFWAIAMQMERDIGRPLFVPHELKQDTAGNVIPIRISAHPAEGHTFVSWSQRGDATDAVVLFRRQTTLSDSHVVTHELLHLLGFGHSNSWRTISEPIGGTETRLTPEDVGHVQLAMRLRQLQEKTGALPGLPAAVQ